jgi:Do/DeqQ family serine protease
VLLRRPPAAEPAPIPAVVDRVAPAVVSIFTRREAGDPFGLFGGPSRSGQGLGSGVIVRADGLIVTNYHVVEDAKELRVVLADRREFRAKIVGRDPETDVALLLVDAVGLPTASLGDSSRVRVGESVLALGNSMGVGQTVSSGIVSATRRSGLGIVEDEDFIQFDAPINPGSSGGPLINLDGEVIGINTAIATRSGGFQGIGFAIPSRMVCELLPILLRDGRVRRGQLGVVVQDVTPALARALRSGVERGVLIADAPERGAAHEAGLRRGDLIVALDGAPVETGAELRHRAGLRGGGASVKVEALRGRERREFSVRLKELVQAPELDSEEDADDGDRDGSVSGLEGISVKGLTVVAIRSSAPLVDLQKGDLIVEVNHAAVGSAAELREAVTRSDDPVLLRIRRSEESVYVAFPK